MLDYEQSVAWIKEYFHLNGFRCPNCKAPVEQAREFRHTERSQLTVYRCRVCATAYNLYTETVFQQRHLTPMQMVLLMRGICKGESSNMLAAELDLDYKTVLELRRDIHLDPDDPPRRRANKQRGHGTYDNDRPPIVGTVGRESGQVRLRVIHHTDQKTLEAHVHQYTLPGKQVYTDEWNGYNHILRPHATVCHSKGEWARDDDGDGIREVHVNTVEGMWTDVRNFLRPFKGVHKRYLSGYVALAEFRRNLKRVSPTFISSIVNEHTSYT